MRLICQWWCHIYDVLVSVESLHRCQAYLHVVTVVLVLYSPRVSSLPNRNDTQSSDRGPLLLLDYSPISRTVISDTAVFQVGGDGLLSPNANHTGLGDVEESSSISLPPSPRELCTGPGCAIVMRYSRLPIDTPSQCSAHMPVRYVHHCLSCRRWSIGRNRSCP